ncbi:MAG: hypothetical protein ABI573_09395 [Chloroflexota bacterium]
MRLYVSSLRKLTTRMASLLTLGILAGLLVMIELAVATTRSGNGGGNGGSRAALALLTFPGAYDAILGFLLGFGGLLGVTYGAAIAGSEWSWGTLKTAVARGESRSRYLLSTFAAIATMLVVGLILAFVIGVAGAAIGSTIAGISLSGMSDTAILDKLPEHFLRGWIAITMTAAVGFTVANVAKSQLAGIGVGIALYFGEAFATIFLPDIVKYLPFNLSNAAVGAGGGFGGPGAVSTALSADTALGLVVVWLVAMLVSTAVIAERAEITG